MKNNKDAQRLVTDMPRSEEKTLGAQPQAHTHLGAAVDSTFGKSVKSSAPLSLDHTEICLSHQEQAWSSGDRCSVEEVVKLFPRPDVAQESETLMALICNEVFLREESGESPTLVEYQERFPQLAELLQTQWEIDGLLTLHESKSLRSDRAPHAGRFIDRYEILSELGRGAMGVVYLAWDPQLKRKIALKRLRTGADSSSEEVDRIRTEAEAIAQIQHPAIVQIFDVGEVEELPFLAMEYCAGGTLGKRLEGKPILPRQAAELIKQICGGVAAAHGRRVIHRDLKPKNILLESDSGWSPKVSDFGLAKLLDSDATATATGNVLGTPAYMSPEQAFGDAKRVGPAADVYSLGAILYECLTGRPPFVGVTIADTLQQVRQREPIPVRQLEPHVPLDLETITHKCMRKDPQQRYATVAELQDDLSRFLDRQPIHARRECWYEAANRLARKYPLVTGLTTALAILLIAVTAVSLVFANSMIDANMRIRESEVVAKLGQANALVSSAHGIRVSHEPGQRFAALDAIREAATIYNELNQLPESYDRMRDEAIRALVLPDAHISHFRTESQKLYNSDFSDDHRLLALSFETGPTSIRQLADHRELSTIPRLDAINMPLFVDNSRLIQAGMPGGAIELWNLAHTIPQRIWQWTPGPKQSPAKPSNLRAFNTNFAIVCDSKVGEVLRMSDGSILAQFSPKPYTLEPFIALHPTHPYLVIHSYFEPGVELRNWETGETILRYLLQSDENATFSGATWTKDGRRLALITGNGSALIWFSFDPDSKKLIIERTQSPAPHQGGGGPYIRFNSCGDRLLFFGWDRSFGLVDANLGLPLFASYAFIETVAGTPRDDPEESLAGIFNTSDESNRYGMMCISHGRERTLLQSEEESGGTLSFSDPTGRILAFARGDKLSILDVATKTILFAKRWPGIDIYSLFFDDHYFYINSQEVCCRFPYEISVEVPSTLSLGVPKRVHIPASTQRLTASDDGKTIANACSDRGVTAQYGGCWAKLETEPAARKIVDKVCGNGSTVSGNGEIIGFWTESMGAVYSQSKGHLELLLSSPRSTTHDLSKDGKWLLHDGKVLSTNTLQTATLKFEGAAYDLTPDGTQVASYGNATTVLSDARTGKVFARFEGIHPRFLPDGSKVVTRVSGDRHALHDMKSIRQGVLDLGIPWTGPDYASCVEPPPVDEVTFVDEMANVENAADLIRVMDEHCEKWARLHPEDGHLAFSAAMLSIDRRNWPEALERLDRSCKLLPEAITPRQWRAYLLAEMRRWPEAIADADWVLERITDTRFRLLRAEWLFRNGDFARSIDECTAIIEYADGFVTLAHGLRHLNFVSLGQDAQASEDRDFFFKNFSEDPDSISDSAYYRVGSDISLRHPQLAKLYIEKLEPMQTDCKPEVRSTIGMVYYRNDEYSRAIECLSPNLADATNEMYAYALSVITMCEAKLDNRDAAEQHLRDLEAWKPPADLTLNELVEIERLKSEARRLCD